MTKIIKAAVVGLLGASVLTGCSSDVVDTATLKIEPGARHSVKVTDKLSGDTFSYKVVLCRKGAALSAKVQKTENLTITPDGNEILVFDESCETLYRVRP